VLKKEKRKNCRGEKEGGTDLGVRRVPEECLGATTKVPSGKKEKVLKDI